MDDSQRRETKFRIRTCNDDLLSLIDNLEVEGETVEVAGNSGHTPQPPLRGNVPDFQLSPINDEGLRPTRQQPRLHQDVASPCWKHSALSVILPILMSGLPPLIPRLVRGWFCEWDLNEPHLRRS